MEWNFKGKYHGYDVNKLPEDYLEWVVQNINNSDMKRTAQKILEFRKSGKMGGSTVKKTVAPKVGNEALIRGLCLLIASNMDKESPFRTLPQVVKYVVFNEIPMNEIAEKEKPVEESPNNNEINNPFLEGLE